MYVSLFYPVVPNLGSIGPLVVQRRCQGVHRIRSFVIQLIGGVRSLNRLKTNGWIFLKIQIDTSTSNYYSV